MSHVRTTGRSAPTRWSASKQHPAPGRLVEQLDDLALVVRCSCIEQHPPNLLTDSDVRGHSGQLSWCHQGIGGSVHRDGGTRPARFAQQGERGGRESIEWNERDIG